MPMSALPAGGDDTKESKQKGTPFSLLHHNQRKVRLVLEDGTVHEGFSFGAERDVDGEVVFNTGMVGYPETLTDPSYRGQILVLTYPLIGNYGVPSMETDELGLPKYFESNAIHVTALIIADYSFIPSHWLSRMSLSTWLKAHNIPAIHGLDTRMLTKKIRVKGSLLGKIIFNTEAKINFSTLKFRDPNLRNLVAEVSRRKVVSYGKGRIQVIAVDCGMKNNIIRVFMSKGVRLKVVPWDYDFNKEQYDGLFLSNGPGDPMIMTKTIQHIKVALKIGIPIFGICLGNQLLALAAGAKTYKMKFGNRGMNQPCIDLRTTLCYITAQNHGFAVDTSSLPSDWKPLFVNANDFSNEGIIHTHKPFFSVQFHPEASGGPMDTSFLFDMFISRIRDKRTMITTINVLRPMPPLRKVLILGSGGLSIGQAGEFDYSGSQAIKALKEENIYVLLINPNIATVQTSENMADKVYFLPVTADFVCKVIERERPDAVLLQFGGQTSLNCGIELAKRGIFKKFKVRVLGTPITAIITTEDREAFSKCLSSINEQVAPSLTATTVDKAVAAAEKLGYPVLVRVAFALGGLGSGFAANRSEMLSLARKAFSSSTQVIVDRSFKGWKEVEYEVVRDCKGNCITVCNMENMDPLGIHTGDSIVVCPSQTLSNVEYFKLRQVAIKVVQHLGVIGECNIQFALDPFSPKYYIIEVNARLSRSSALASKASGYPLAYVAAKLALGKSLTDIRNSVTKCTSACFEPSLDYVVVKFPVWEMRKFAHVSSAIGSSMKSVGEVMAIGRTFEEAFMKGIRMVDPTTGFGRHAGVASFTTDELNHALSHPSDRRVYALGVALQRGYTLEQIHKLTRIDKWFLSKLFHIIQIENMLKGFKSIARLPPSFLKYAKQYGFSDCEIGLCVKETELKVRKFRQQCGIVPYVKQIDTLAAEFPAQTNYLYMTYNGSEHDISFDVKGTIVLGCGAYRIGSSCEFDWCAVSCLKTLRKEGYKSIMINYNPETVSTDYDVCDRLYFEELSFERVLDIYEVEHSSGVIVSVGGQIPNNLALPLYKAGVRVLGTHPKNIDAAENRFTFSKLLDSIGVDQPPWKELTTVAHAKAFSAAVGYPVLIRPSYVLSGAAMNVALNSEHLENYLSQATRLSIDHPVVITKFIMKAKEIEIDAVANNGLVLNYAISEHIENAGVHSGDATLVLPAQKLYVETIRRIKKITGKVALALKITGPFNIQFLSKDNDIKVIECNLRASRSFPYSSKTFGVNFIELATKCIMGVKVRPKRIRLFDVDYVNIKVPVFSFIRLQGADPTLRVEMASTGEVSCFGTDKYEAYLKALLASGFRIPRKKKNVLVSIGLLPDKVDFLESASILIKLKYKIYATIGTAKFLKDHGISATVLHKRQSGLHPTCIEYLKSGKINLVINIPNHKDTDSLSEGYYMRRTAVDFSVPLLNHIKTAILLVGALKRFKTFQIKSWDEYLK